MFSFIVLYLIIFITYFIILYCVLFIEKSCFDDEMDWVK